MKQLLLLAAVVSFFGCTKEKIIESIPGTWTIIETNDGDTGGAGFKIQTYSPSSEISLHFGENGDLQLEGSNPGKANSPLWHYDRYELLEGHTIRFYQSSGNKQQKAYFEIEGDLYLNYINSRHGYEEKFLRVK